MAKPLIIGSHVLALRKGGSVDETNKTGTFVEVGVVSDAEIVPAYQTRDHMYPTPGGRRLKAVVPGGFTLGFNFTLMEVQALGFELAFGTAALSAGAIVTMNPMEGGVPWEGWLKLQAYDGTDALVAVVDLYSSLTVQTVALGEDIVSFKMEGKVIDSTLNEGTLTDLE